MNCQKINPTGKQLLFSDSTAPKTEIWLRDIQRRAWCSSAFLSRNNPLDLQPHQNTSFFTFYRLGLHGS